MSSNNSNNPSALPQHGSTPESAGSNTAAQGARTLLSEYPQTQRSNPEPLRHTQGSKLLDPQQYLTSAPSAELDGVYERWKMRQRGEYPTQDGGASGTTGFTVPAGSNDIAEAQRAAKSANQTGQQAAHQSSTPTPGGDTEQPSTVSQQPHSWDSGRRKGGKGKERQTE